MDVTRPSPKETEEEILCSQREFLSKKFKPSAQVVNKRKVQSESFSSSGNDSLEETKKLKFRNTARSSTSQKREVEDTDFAPVDNHDMQSAEVLLDIMEHDNAIMARPPELVPISFPEPFVRNKMLKFQEGNRKKSIFAQQMEKKQKKMLCKSSEAQQSCSFSNIAKGSSILEGSGLKNNEDINKIHEDNLAKLESMSKEEIIAQQKKLLQQLDPGIVKFLQNKRKSEKVDSNETKNYSLSDTNVCQLKSEESENNLTMDNETSVRREETVMDVDSKSCQEERIPSSENMHRISADIKVDMAMKLAEENKWLHMNIVEKEKLAWTSELPPPKPIDTKTGYPARFDFKGNLLARDINIPVGEGLHHHGEEQEVPGYTIEELFLISRSSFHSQSVIALQTLAAIIQKNQQGLFDECFESVLTQQLLDAGIVPLLRWALDESAESMFAAALLTIRNLIFNDFDEICLDQTFSWKDGYVAPFLEPLEESQDEESKPEEMTDIEIVKLDVVKGFLRMDILPRLRYILEVCHPEAISVSYIFDILIRIGRHSLESATRILECPRLMKTIVSEFLPCSWKFADIVKGKQFNVYGFPLSSAVKLIRVLASAGRHIAARLIAHFDILNPLWSFTTMDPSDRRLPFPEGFFIANEAVRTWRIFLAYGLAVEQYSDLFTVLVERLKFCQSLNVNTNTEKNQYHFAALLFSIFEAVITVILNRSKNEIGNESAPLTWHCIADVYGVIEVCWKKWLWQIVSDEGSLTTAGVIMVGSCLNFVSEYYRCAIKMCPTSAVDILQKVESLSNGFLLPVLKSACYRKLLANLSSYSMLLCEMTPGSLRSASTLPSLGCIMWASDVIPIIKEGTPFPLLISIANLISVIQGIHHDMKEVATELINTNILRRYVHQLVEVKRLRTTQWHSRFEIRFLYTLANLSAHVCPHPIYYKLGIRLLSGISSGDEYLAVELMTTVIFNYEFLREYGEVDQKLQHLQIEDTVLVKSATGECLEINDMQLLTRTCQELPAICSMYINSCFRNKALEKSRWLIEQSCNKINNVGVKAFENPLLTREWPYYPIKQFYKEAKSANLQQDSSSQEVVTTVIRCLQWIHLLEIWHYDLMKRIPAGIRFSNLSIMFLIGSDTFLNSDVQKYCQSILCELLKKTKNKKWKLETLNSPGITSFSDLYTELLIQFEATSYGDHLFGNVITLPLQQCYDSFWKKQLFTEHSGVLRILNVPLNELLVPVDKYLNPPESNEQLLHSYARSLFSGQLRATWCPLMHKMAVHHLHSYLIKGNDSQQQLELLLELLNFVKTDERKIQISKNLLNSIMS